MTLETILLAKFFELRDECDMLQDLEMSVKEVPHH